MIESKIGKNKKTISVDDVVPALGILIGKGLPTWLYVCVNSGGWATQRYDFVQMTGCDCDYDVEVEDPWAYVARAIPGCKGVLILEIQYVKDGKMRRIAVH